MTRDTNQQQEMATDRQHPKRKPKAPEWLIENIAEASKNARKIYFLYIGFLAYCALTVVSTSDRQIILNETASLPFLRLEVSLNGFFILAPLLAIFVFVYFHLYLYRLKRLIRDLRTNYALVEKTRLYPWMVNIAEDPDPGLIGRLQKTIVSLSLWASLPIVLFLIAIWFVKKHDPFLSYLVGISPMLGTFVVLFFWCQYEDTQMKGFFRRNLGAIFIYIGFFIISAFLIFPWLRHIVGRFIPFHIFDSVSYLLMGVVFILLCSLLRYSYLKIRGVSWESEGKAAMVSGVFTFGVLLVSMVIPYSNGGRLISVDLSHQKLVTEPQKDYEGLFWADFSNAHLEGAYLANTVLKRADLRYARLQNAMMQSAILEKADLSEADLQGANLSEANLRRASLMRANLREASLSGANLQGANLRGVNLRGAWLYGAGLREADLQGAYLKLANLQGANLGGANFQKASLWRANLQGVKNLTITQLSKVGTLYEAKLDPELKGQIKKDYPRLLEEPKGLVEEFLEKMGQPLHLSPNLE